MNNRVKTTNDLDLKDRLVAINRVTKVTKGGRAFTFAAIVVVGNENGIVGWGLGKANEVQAAIAKRAVLESVGITDVLAKSKGSSNPHNLVKATIAALGEMRSPAQVAQNRGISVEQVFKG